MIAGGVLPVRVFKSAGRPSREVSSDLAGIVLHLKEHFMAFNLIYWTLICREYFVGGSVFEKKMEKRQVTMAGFFST